MTDEEEPYQRPRPYRKTIYQVIFVLVSLQTLYLTFHSHSAALNEWPADLTDRAAYCRVETYQSCQADQWFGILKSRAAGNMGALGEICKGWTDKPDAAQVRMIETADGDTLYLCKMKAPATIDAAKAHF